MASSSRLGDFSSDSDDASENFRRRRRRLRFERQEHRSPSWGATSLRRSPLSPERPLLRSRSPSTSRLPFRREVRELSSPHSYAEQGVPFGPPEPPAWSPRVNRSEEDIESQVDQSPSSSSSTVITEAWRLIRSLVPPSEYVVPASATDFDAVPLPGHAVPDSLPRARPLSASVLEMFERYNRQLSGPDAALPHGLLSVKSYRSSTADFVPKNSPLALSRAAVAGIAQLSPPHRTPQVSVAPMQRLELARRSEDTAHLASFSSLALLAIRGLLDLEEWNDSANQALISLLESLEWAARNSMAASVALLADCRLLQRDAVLSTSTLPLALRSDLRRSTLAAGSIFDPSLQSAVSAHESDPTRTLERAVTALTSGSRRGGFRGAFRPPAHQRPFLPPTSSAPRRGRRFPRRGRGFPAYGRSRPRQSS